MKTAIVTGVTGQDGSYLSELLLEKQYRVIGVHRRSSTLNLANLVNVVNNENFSLYCCDITDGVSVNNLVAEFKPDEIYNLAAQSFVKASFDQPVYTFLANTIGPLNFLEAIKNISPTTRFYQASTSEQFGKNFKTRVLQSDNFSTGVIGKSFEKYQDETTEMVPQSPYGVAKLAAHHLVRIYREAYGIYASASLLYNHESERRGKEFVTRKISNYIGNLVYAMKNKQEYPKLKLGNLDACRDFGYAKDYVQAIYLILQKETPDDYVISTGETHSIREFCELAFSQVGLNYEEWVEIDPKFFRPAEVDYLCGDSTVSKILLDWQPKTTFEELVKIMVQNDIKEVEHENR
jgi:GDPmannose 4,6-dehydratase